ncbi:MAG: thiolase family protein [Actinomycetota bacterium]|jgi:acetyl-CoA acetyltransferase|nr:thiolase family protein [Actinomycetota bacterium]MDA8281272.1 thiolase family protein [Actinomycetota bacterium]
MNEVVVIGTGMTRFGKFFDRSVRSLAEEAVTEALGDAGIGPEAVEFTAFANAAGGILQCQEMIRGQSALHHTGLLGSPIVNVENACASASSAVHLAWQSIASGSAEIALAVGAEKLTHADKMRSFAAIGTAIDLEDLSGIRDMLSTVLLGWPPPAAPAGGTPDAAASAGSAASGGSGGKLQSSPFMQVYAQMTQLYLSRSGGTKEDLAAVSVKNHRHASENPKAQYRDLVTIDEVLASRIVADPLTVLMCSPIADGAAALVLATPEAAARLGVPAVKVLASVLASGRDRSLDEPSVAERASLRAYEQAGIGPEDLNVLEVHDAAATAELQLYEELGLCPAGEGPKLLASGATTIGGRVPVNPSGGLLSRGHPIGATGCGQLVELADQLRGRCGARQVEGARFALAENGGGFIGADAAATVITILGS